MPVTTTGNRLTTVLFYGAVLLLAYLVYRVFEPFLEPLGWAGVLVVVFYPLHSRLESRWGRTRAAAASTAGITLLLIVPALMLMVLFVREGVQAAVGIQQAVAHGQMPAISRAWEWVVRHLPGNEAGDLPSALRQGAESVAGWLASVLGTVLRNAAVFLFKLFVTLFALFYLFRDASSVLDLLRRLLPFEETARAKMFQQARDLISASVTSSLIVAGVQGTLGGLAFALVGLGTPVFWGVVMAFLSLLPVIGAWMVWLPGSLWLFANGHTGRGIALLVICLAMVSTVDNVLRPMLISGRARLSGLLVFIGVLGGIAVFGMIGVVLGPIVVATAASVLEVYTRGAGEAEGAVGGGLVS